MDCMPLDWWLLLHPVSAIENAVVVVRRLDEPYTLPLDPYGRPVGSSALAVYKAEAAIFL